jgi:hypothetical protein
MWCDFVVSHCVTEGMLRTCCSCQAEARIDVHMIWWWSVTVKLTHCDSRLRSEWALGGVLTVCVLEMYWRPKNLA